VGYDARLFMEPQLASSILSKFCEWSCPLGWQMGLCHAYHPRMWMYGNSVHDACPSCIMGLLELVYLLVDAGGLAVEAERALFTTTLQAGP